MPKVGSTETHRERNAELPECAAEAAGRSPAINGVALSRYLSINPLRARIESLVGRAVIARNRRAAGEYDELNFRFARPAALESR